MNQFSIIGLVGRAGAGKDTIAHILSEAVGHVPVAFADALRTEISQAFCIDARSLMNRYTKEIKSQALAICRCTDSRFVHRMANLGESTLLPRSPRQIMQWWGTEYRRQVDSEIYWVERLQDTIDSMLRTGIKKIAVTDVRFENEAELIHLVFGTLWKVVRLQADQVSVSHISESEQDRIVCDVVVQNNGSLDQLIIAVNHAYGQRHGQVKK